MLSSSWTPASSRQSCRSGDPVGSALGRCPSDARHWTEIQGDERPAGPAAALHQRGEVEQRAGEAIKLRNHECGRTTAVKGGQGGLQAGAPRKRPTRSGVLVDLGKAPAPTLAFVADCATLSLKPRARVELLVCRHPDVADDGQWHRLTQLPRKVRFVYMIEGVGPSIPRPLIVQSADADDPTGFSRLRGPDPRRAERRPEGRGRVTAFGGGWAG